MTREEAIKILEEIIDEGWLISDFDKCIAIDACEMAIKALEQEPFINKPCVSSEVCEHDKQKVLDKIRAEIKGMTPTYHNPDWSITDLVPISKVIDVVDKYKAEIEPQKSKEQE